MNHAAGEGVGQGIGPAFDTGTLSIPTPRKLVGCWMEQAGRRTLIVPQVWRELAQAQGPRSREYPKAAWRYLAAVADSPYELPVLTDEQEETAYSIRAKFTTACFPGSHPASIHAHSDAVVVSQSLALGTDVLVTGDIRTIDHYEINAVIDKLLGRNAPFVTTLDDALCRAYAAGDAAQEMLAMALSTVAPPAARASWPIEDARTRLAELRAAMAGSSLTTASQRLETRWHECRDLTPLLERARSMAHQSNVLRCERMRADMHRAGLAALKAQRV